MNPDPSIPVVPTHHILHKLDIMSCRVRSHETALLYLSVHSVPHYELDVLSYRVPKEEMYGIDL